MSGLDARIAEWRGYVDRARAIEPGEADELEGHLREQIDALRDAGLDDDEAFLVGVKRLGAVDAISAEFARSNSGRMWKQLVAAPPVAHPGGSAVRSNGLALALVIGVVAALAFQILRLTTVGDLDSSPIGDPSRLLRNAGIIPVAAVAVWLLLRYRRGLRLTLWTLVPLAIVTLVVNLLPLAFSTGAQSGLLAVVHAPIALWLLVGLAYTGDDWRSASRRMDFVRFTGEAFVYYVLLALGGGVLFAIASAILAPLVPGITLPLTEWGLYSGAIIAFPFAAWLVELKQSVIENIAPVLARIFTPLFALVTGAAAIVYLVLGATRPFDRDLMAIFDALLVVVLGLVLYALSARSEGRATRFFDLAGLVTVVAALVLDVVVLIHLAVRIGDYGWTPNRVAALGLNLLLVVILAIAGWISARQLARRASVAPLEHWLMGSLPAYSVWAALVALVLPPVFGFA